MTNAEMRERVFSLANLEASPVEFRKILTSLTDEEIYMLRLYFRLGVLAFLEESEADRAADRKG